MLRIDSCNAVRFGSDSINNMRNLRNIELSNIANLYFEDSSLSWNSYVQTNNDFYTWDSLPTLKIKIEKSTIRKISSFTFKGRIHTIMFRDSLIEDLAPFAFSSLTHNQIIDFFNVEFINVQAQAFKKFPTESLILTNSSFAVLPSRAFSDVTVTKAFLIKDCRFNTIRSSAFLIHNPEHFEIMNSELNVLEGEGFKVMTRGSVKIENNVFNTTYGGAFVGISLDKEKVYTKEEILFNFDTFNYLERKSLEINSTSFSAKYSNIFINQECTCQFTNYEMEDNKDHEEFQCLFEDNKRITLKEFKENHCSVLSGYSTIIIVLGVVLILFIIIFSGLLFYFKRVYKNQQEYLTDKNGKPISVIMPDGRTYRETELHVVVERADLLTTDL
ncbi:hypothetical protein ILUMI_18307 [Ignelater luminosus]|uniref:Uncharacterized protein n=1 Tax=Ignelater luminosus TaxID=2038154 RepID=A0A8K0G6P2_IGNLU|nr:hypothetical protein ILUMI_18307 [Ignelater luminosus]